MSKIGVRVHCQSALASSVEMYFLRQHNDPVLSRRERQKLIVDQLRRQNSMKRILVSDAISSLVDYIVSHEKEDLLLQGSMVKNKGLEKDKRMENNPFRLRPNKANNCVIS